MSALGDPADKLIDAQADGAFGGKHTTNRRAGYSKTVTINGEEITELEWLIRRAKKDATLASGEGRKIVEHYEEHIAAVEAERDQMESMYRHHVAIALDAVAKLNHAQAILAALREPSAAVIHAGYAAWADASLKYQTLNEGVADMIRAAVAAADKEAAQ